MSGRNEVIKVTKTYIAGSVIADRRFVAIDANGRVNHAADGVEIKGVSMEAASATLDPVSVALQNAGNIVRVESAAAVTLGGQVASAADGKAKDSASADIEVGQADEGSTQAGEYAIVHLTRGGTTT
jgi:hypothetical protein